VGFSHRNVRQELTTSERTWRDHNLEHVESLSEAERSQSINGSHETMTGEPAEQGVQEDRTNPSILQLQPQIAGEYLVDRHSHREKKKGGKPCMWGHTTKKKDQVGNCRYTLRTKNRYLNQCHHMLRRGMTGGSTRLVHKALNAKKGMSKGEREGKKGKRSLIRVCPNSNN